MINDWQLRLPNKKKRNIKVKYPNSNKVITLTDIFIKCSAENYCYFIDFLESSAHPTSFICSMCVACLKS